MAIGCAISTSCAVSLIGKLGETTAPSGADREASLLTTTTPHDDVRAARGAGSKCATAHSS